MPRCACAAGSASATGCGRSSSRPCKRGARWSSVPLGSPGCVDGPFLEGGDTLLNGREVYVGISGCASDLAGVDWLQALLGDDVPRDPGGDEVERPAPRLRLGADQARPAGLVPAEADRRPADVAARLGQDRGLGRRGQPARDQRPGPRGRPRHHRRRQRARDRRTAQAQDRRDSRCRSTARSRTGGGLRCAHHPLLRESVLA